MALPESVRRAFEREYGVPLGDAADSCGNLRVGFENSDLLRGEDVGISAEEADRQNLRILREW